MTFELPEFSSSEISSLELSSSEIMFYKTLSHFSLSIRKRIFYKVLILIIMVDCATRRPRTSGIFSAPNLFEKDYWTTILFLVDSFQHSNLRSLSKIDKNCIKTLKFGKFWFFVIFGLNLIYFSFRKQPLSLRKSILDNEFLPFLSR